MLRIKKADLASITLDEGKYKMAAIFRLSIHNCYSIYIILFEIYVYRIFTLNSKGIKYFPHSLSITFFMEI